MRNPSSLKKNSLVNHYETTRITFITNSDYKHYSRFRERKSDLGKSFTSLIKMWQEWHEQQEGCCTMKCALLMRKVDFFFQNPRMKRDINLRTLTPLLHLLVYKCPDDSQCVQHQAIYILLFPSWLMGPSPSPRRPDRVPGPTAPSLSSINTYACTVIHPPGLSSGCSRWSMLVVLQVTIFSTYTAVTHGSNAGDQTGKAFPEWTKGIWGGEEEQNLYKAPAGTESDPGGYYHIIWRAWFWGILVPVGWVGPV